MFIGIIYLKEGAPGEPKYYFDTKNTQAIMQKLETGKGFIFLSQYGEAINIYNIDRVKIKELTEQSDDYKLLHKHKQRNKPMQNFLSNNDHALGKS